MDEMIFLELLDASGRVHQRVRIDSAPLIIGRAYTADVIVDDQFVSPQHLRISRGDDGKLFAEDLHSTNGVYRLSPTERVTRIDIVSDCRLRIGQTILRFRSASYPVEPAVQQGIAATLPRPLRRPAVRAAVAGLALAAFIAVDNYLGTYQRASPARFVSGIGVLAVIFMVWCGLWALANRTVSHRFRFADHCAVAAAGGLVLAVFLTVEEYIEFAFSADRLARISSWGGLTLILSGIIFGHVRCCSTAGTRRIAMISVGVAGAFAALVGTFAYAGRSTFSGALDYPGQLKPPSFSLSHGESSSAFFASTRDTKNRVDKLAKDD